MSTDSPHNNGSLHYEFSSRHNERNVLGHLPGRERPRLRAKLRQAWSELGVRVVTPRDPETRSGITTFQVSTDPAENEAFLQRLLDERIYLAMRYTSGVGGIRVSTHYFNDEEDLAALFAAVRRLLPAARRVPLLAQE